MPPRPKVLMIRYRPNCSGSSVGRPAAGGGASGAGGPATELWFGGARSGPEAGGRAASAPDADPAPSGSPGLAGGTGKISPHCRHRTLRPMSSLPTAHWLEQAGHWIWTTAMVTHTIGER